MRRIDSLSRRAFLRRAALVVAAPAVSLPGLESIAAPAPPDPRAVLFGASLGLPPGGAVAGRAFAGVDVLSAPATGARVGHVWPDAVVPITGLSDDGFWYAVQDGGLAGYIARVALQPIQPYREAWTPSGVPHGYHEVIAPIAPVREACTGGARVLARLGFGALVYVHSGLTDDLGTAWAEVTVSEVAAGFRGWVSRAHLRPAAPASAESDVPAPTIRIDTRRQSLAVYDESTGRLLGDALMYFSPLAPGTAWLRPFAPAAWSPVVPFAYPWVMTLQAGTARIPVSGAWWHNKFGLGDGRGGWGGLPAPKRPRRHELPGVELPVWAARYLYGLAARAARSGRALPVVVD
jgi:hypothetical protein